MDPKYNPYIYNLLLFPLTEQDLKIMPDNYRLKILPIKKNKNNLQIRYSKEMTQTVSATTMNLAKFLYT